MAPTPLAKIAAAVYYGVASFTVQFVNKALFTTYQFNYPITVALLQMLFMSPVCYLVAKPKLERKTARAVLPLAVVNVFNLVSGLVGTGGLNVPMFIALRRFTLLLTVTLEFAMFKKVHSRTTYATIAVMMAGAFVAAITDLTFNLKGYLAVFTNDIFTALYLVLIKHIKAAKEMTTVALLFYNSLLCLPFLGVGLIASGEMHTWQLYPRVHETSFWVILAASSILGLTVNHSQFLCTRVNEPLMTSVTGQMKNIISTVAGTFMFGDFKVNIYNVLGLMLSTMGSLWYAAQSGLRSHTKQEVLPLKNNQDSNGYVNDKLKNYTQLSTSPPLGEK